MKNLKKSKKQSISFIFIWLLIASFVLLFAKPLLAGTISTQFPEYYYNNKWGRKIVAWGDTHHYNMGMRSWNQVSVNLPSTGDYKIVVRYYADGTAEQTHEEFKILIDGNYIGRTTDCGTGCYENENLGTRHLGAGGHTVKAEHLWTLADWNSPNSVSPLSISFELITPPPTVDIKANNSDGPITIDYNTSATLSWTSTNATSCSASGNWSGSKATSGSENTGNLISSKTYTITCTGPGGSATDSVTVYVSSQPILYVTLEAIPNSGYAPLNDVDLRATVSGTAEGEITYRFDCTNDGDWEQVFDSYSETEIAGDLCDYSSAGTYTAKVRVYREGLSATDTDTIYVEEEQEETLYVDLDADPETGTEPLNNVDLTADVSGTAEGEITYKFDCENDGDWDYVGNSYSEIKTVVNLCDYEKDGTYTAKVKVYRDGLTATDTDTIYVYKAEEEVSLNIDKKVRNQTKGQTSWYSTISASPSDKIAFRIKVTSTGDDTAEDVIIKDTLPEKFAWQGNLKVDGKDFDGDISDGIEIGNLSPGRSKTITFEALIASKEEFVYGTTDLINAALVYNVDTSVTDTAKVRVTRTAVVGAVTEVPTGILSSAKVSLFITILIILLATYLLLLKSYFSQKTSSLRFNEIVFDAKEKAKNFFLGIYQSPKERSEKRLSRFIEDIKVREGLE